MHYSEHGPLPRQRTLAHAPGITRRTHLLVMLLACAAGPVWADPYDDALAAHQRGQWEEAFNGFLTHAQQGDARSQFRLSLLYASGKGTAANPTAALQWLRSAALQGHADAQSNLGSHYARGKGVAPDPLRAYAWFTLAAQAGSVEARTNLQVAARRMSAPQREAAQALTVKCRTEGLNLCL